MRTVAAREAVRLTTCVMYHAIADIQTEVKRKPVTAAAALARVQRIIGGLLLASTKRK